MTSAAAPALTRRHPLWVLAKKELRLQHMTLAVVGVYLLVWLVVLSLRHRVIDWQDDVFLLVTSCYFGLVSLVIGSLASAEERQLGTLPSQVLLPFSTWKQWAVKVGMASGLALLLALGLPVLLAYLSAIIDPTLPPPSAFIRPQSAVAVVLLTTLSLYVSSISTSGLQAVLLSLPALLGAALFGAVLIEPLGTMASALSLPYPGVLPLVGLRRFEELALLLTAGFIVLALRFALVNHRSDDRAAGRVLTQVGWMAGYAAITVVIVSSLG